MANMAQIQELQQQLIRLHRQSSTPDGNGHVIASWPLRVWLPTSWSPTLVSPSEDEDED